MKLLVIVFGFFRFTYKTYLALIGNGNVSIPLSFSFCCSFTTVHFKLNVSLVIFILSGERKYHHKIGWLQREPDFI